MTEDRDDSDRGQDSDSQEPLDQATLGELQQLLLAALEGALTDEQFERLDDLVGSDPAARAEYQRQLETHALLMYGYGYQKPMPPGEPGGPPEALAEFIDRLSDRAAWEDEVNREAAFLSETSSGEASDSALFGGPDLCAIPDLDESVPQIAEKKRRPSGGRTPVSNLVDAGRMDPSDPSGGGVFQTGVGWSSLVFFMLFAVALGAVGMSVWQATVSGPGGQDLAKRRSGQPILKMAPVAYLSSANSVTWGDGQSQFETAGGGVLQGEKVVLQQGIAEFRLASGIGLSIEGPTEMALESPTSIALDEGTLTAHVPWIGADCRIHVADYTLSTGEAEFGLVVSKDKTAIHVFSGAVTLFGKSTAKPESSKRPAGPNGERSLVVSTGKSLLIVRADDEPELVWGKADEGLFASKLKMAGLLPVSRAYVASVLASAPIGYWRFESIEGDMLPNEVASGLPLKVTGELRLQGDSKNRLAEFGRPGADECFLMTPEPVNALAGKDSYSVELWIKPSHVHWAGLAALLANPTTNSEGHAFYLELQGPAADVFSPYEEVPHPGSVRFLHRDPPSEKGRKEGVSCFSEVNYAVRRWQHVVAVKDGAEMRLYLDGQLVDTQQDETSLAPDLYLLIGRARTPQRASISTNRLPNFPFVGQLDELAVYDSALTEKEVEAHYNAINRVLDGA